jgi:hypothetical protein
MSQTSSALQEAASPSRLMAAIFEGVAGGFPDQVE